MPKIKTFITILLFLTIGMYSCLDTNNTSYDEEWKAYQEEVYSGIQTLKEEDGQYIYYEVTSESGLGRVYCRASDFITKRMTGNFDQKEPDVYGPATRSTPQKPVYITDSVIVRYQGWYYNTDGKFITFDGTEGDNNNNAQAGFRLGSVTDGFRTALMDMSVGEERIVCMPANMGYGSTAKGSIPAYTTLFFDIKLLELYQQP